MHLSAGWVAMRINLPLCCVAFIFSWLSIALSDELPPKLPDDGWWIRYHVVTKEVISGEESTEKIRYALVGTFEEGGKKCRWLEMRVEQENDPDTKISIFKFPIPEKELLESEKPLETVVRKWHKHDDMQAVQDEYVPGQLDLTFGHFVLFFPGPQKKSKPVEKARTTEYQRGRLEITEGRAGNRKATRGSSMGADTLTFTFTSDFTLWNHPDVPLGFAAGTIRTEITSALSRLKSRVGRF